MLPGLLLERQIHIEWCHLQGCSCNQQLKDAAKQQGFSNNAVSVSESPLLACSHAAFSRSRAHALDGCLLGVPEDREGTFSTASTQQVAEY